MPEPSAADLRDHVAFDADRAVRSRVHETDLLAVDMVCMQPGQQLGARTYDESDALYVVVGGRAWVVTDGEEVTLDPLQSVLVPAGTPHGIRNDSPDPLLLQVVSSLPIAVGGPGRQSRRGTTSNEPETAPDGRSSRRSPA